MIKCCGTCKRWMRENDPPYCGWEEPLIPFWAYISDGDHGIYTQYGDGKNCRTYKPCDAS